jgi:hypothetical protein
MTDNDNRELQVAAVKLWYDGRSQDITQEQVAHRLREMYPEQGRFDKKRVHRLCQLAIGAKLADKPTPARLRDDNKIRKLIERVEAKEQFVQMTTTLDRHLDYFCQAGRFPHKPRIFIVAGAVEKPPEDLVSQFAISAAACAVDLVNDWHAVNGGQRALVGVTWGRQPHLIGLAANATWEQARVRDRRASFIPLLGLPIGEHSAATLSSSEIARLLNGTALRGTVLGDKDLRLVPAYFPRGVFEDDELPSLYKLLSIINGWTATFGLTHLDASKANAVNPGYEVNKCNFIWSSISDFGEPFGMSPGGPRAWIPFLDSSTTGSTTPELPVADCGGIPLWSDDARNNSDALELSFRRRWTGIRREQWMCCVDKGFARARHGNAVCGTAIFAPTQAKARSLLYAMRDGLANILVLGVPCAAKLLELLEGQSATRL